MRDPGLQPQRTELAWTRTSLLVAANAILVVRAGMVTHRSILLLLGIVLGVSAIALVVVERHRARQLTRHGRAPSSRLVAFTAGLVVLAAATGLLASIG